MVASRWLRVMGRDAYLVTENRCLPVAKPMRVAANTVRNSRGLTNTSNGVFQLLIFHASTLINCVARKSTRQTGPGQRGINSTAG